MVDDAVQRFCQQDLQLREALGTVIFGQPEAIDAATCALLAGGHLLLVGVPGTGKTRLAESVADSTGLTRGRIQFTPDLLPADILGGETLLPGSSGDRIEFRPGPVFTQLLIADEINRGTPRTQSALLEAMQEYSVTISTNRHRLDPLFSVIATRNPIELEGTYPLPEAQRDRFLLEVPLHSPAPDVLTKIAAATTIESQLTATKVLDPKQIETMRQTVLRVIAADSVIERAARWIAATRPEDPSAPELIRRGVRLGAGARALQALVLTGKVEALRCGRTHLADEDWRRWRHEVIRHRLVYSLEGELDGLGPQEIVSAVDRAVAHQG
ncbi:MAG: AAA family ATPase [Planctomycetota bacterium]|nr:AAA family ATPase [Planctomycetota bacterium]